MSIQETDAASAAVAKAPRVTLSDIEGEIDAEHYVTADKCVPAGLTPHPALKIMTICTLVMRNGFVVLGKSAPASPENFNAELGRKFAYEDAIRQLWPLMGYALKDRLSKGV